MTPVVTRMSEGPNKPKTGGGGTASPHDAMLWPLAATKFAVDAMFWWLDQGGTREPPADRPELSWTTPNGIALELSTMQLRDFSRSQRGQPILICGPYALHSTLI